MSNVKTNAMRILDKHKIAYKTYCYADTGAVSGTEVAAALGQNPAHITFLCCLLPRNWTSKKPPAPSMKNRWKC